MLGRLKQAVRREDGQALVEFALVLPILLLVLFGIFSFGSAINNWNDETSLANLGARYAAVGSLPGTAGDPTCGSNTTIVSYVACQAQHTYHMSTTSGTYGLQGPVTVTMCAPGGTAAGDPIEINVTANYKFLPSVLGRGFAQATLTGAATMRLENPLPSSLYTGTLPTTGCSS